MAAGSPGSPGLPQNPAYRPSPAAFRRVPFILASRGCGGNNRPGGGKKASEADAGTMQDRLNQNDVTNRVNVEQPATVRDAVMRLFATRYPGAELAPLERAFADVQAL